MLSGKILRDAIISGANNIINNKESVDELNVFPVPDGDTGTNMSMTIRNAVAELNMLSDSVTVETVAQTAASAMLRGARGNSGVILSLLFRGLSKGLAGKHEATVEDYCNALKLGAEAAYKSVMKPTEGTILTVARVAAEKANDAQCKDFPELFDVLTTAAKETLDQTPEMLPVLKKAGVVDAGGMGYYTILKGMASVICGGVMISAKEETATEKAVVTNAAGTFETDIEFTYCTEFIVVKSDVNKDATKLRAFLESIGDCVVVVDDDSIIKVHVHTEHPGKALEEGILYGSLINLKIENMKEQHKGAAAKAEMQKKQKLAPAEPVKDFGFVSVTSGAGLEDLFKDLGVDVIVRGGQTMNPSTEDILEAINATPARNIFVLPNNKNIIMAAEQAVKLTDRNVIVLQTRTIPQGITAMLAFDESSDFSTNGVNMTKALDNVGSGSITFAVRDSDFEGKQIKKGEILAMENGKLAFVEKDVTKALIKITKKLIRSGSSYITIIYGSDVTDETAQAAFEALRAKISDDIEIVLVNGGQPVYYYLISVE
ncbi:DAK2 domain-containing protein [[Eubacterium] siraeum]|jgi:DAK2 domain fusion protein YloV|uniref:DAK2 domain-containing protein n=1 Tax=[Eubacterium] siraeum TaxID=39492 RepID=A0AAW6D192_9FIRM|nr:DAK2 domain-containing protein [[Eubacterium] siraeum]MDB8002542.1 DAK2 domain-containing protein [[Eubacterium] siraeum]